MPEGASPKPPKPFGGSKAPFGGKPKPGDDGDGDDGEEA